MKKINTKMIVYGAFFVAIALLLGGGIQRATGIPTSIDLHIGGAKQSIDLTAIPLVMSGIILGPIGAFMVGFTYDNLGFILFKGGSGYNPIFTIADILLALIPAMIYWYIKKKKITFSISKWIIVFLGIYGIFAISLTSLLSHGGGASQKLFQIISFENGFKIVNIGLFLGVVVAIGISMVIFYILDKKHQNKGMYTFEKIYLVVFLGVLSRSLVSGYGLWAMQVTSTSSIPLIYYWITRLITPLIIVPVITTMMMAFHYIFKKYGN